MKYFLPVCLVTVLLSFGSKAQTVIPFDVPGGVNTQALAISDLGQITGEYQIPNTTRVRGFVRDLTGNIVTFDVAGMNTYPAAINAWGQITGLYATNAAGTPPFHSFLRQPNGSIITFDAPDAWDTEATAINARGDIVGWMQSNLSASNPNTFQGFLRHADGSIATFEVNDAFVILPTAIDARGRVIGYWTDPSASRGRGFLLEPDGQIVDMDAPAALTTNTWPYAINPRGQVTGIYTLHCPFPPGSCTTDSHSFLREPDGQYLNIDVPNTTYTVALAIDARGQVAGYTYESTTQQMRGFLREPKGSFRTFEVPNSNWTVPFAMNIAGEVTGMYLDSNGGAHSFVLIQ